MSEGTPLDSGNRHRRGVAALLGTPSPDRDSDWLVAALQIAAQLELSTIPVYLCAMWSIVDAGGPAYDRIRSIVIDEMGHLGLICNMVTTLGATPQLSTPAVMPSYPGPLPGGVRPQLTVALAGLTRTQLAEVLMEIEYPENGPIALVAMQTYPTIGNFYDAIEQAFQNLSPSAITGARQLTSSAGVTKIAAVADALTAVRRIKEQGEGTSDSPLASDFGGATAHYYKFAEIFHGAAIQKGSDGKWRYDGAAVPFPNVYPMATVPPGGYTQAREFDQAYTQLLQKLETAWSEGAQGKLNAAIGDMFDLGDPARMLMQQPIPGGSGNYGPSFQYVP